MGALDDRLAAAVSNHEKLQDIARRIVAMHEDTAQAMKQPGVPMSFAIEQHEEWMDIIRASYEALGRDIP